MRKAHPLHSYFEKGEDDNGRYLEFEVPSLQYWDLLYMKKQER